MRSLLAGLGFEAHGATYMKYARRGASLAAGRHRRGGHPAPLTGAERTRIKAKVDACCEWREKNAAARAAKAEALRQRGLKRKRDQGGGAGGGGGGGGGVGGRRKRARARRGSQQNACVIL